MVTDGDADVGDGGGDNNEDQAPATVSFPKVN